MPPGALPFSSLDFSSLNSLPLWFFWPLSPYQLPQIPACIRRTWEHPLKQGTSAQVYSRAPQWNTGSHMLCIILPKSTTQKIIPSYSLSQIWPHPFCGLWRCSCELLLSQTRISVPFSVTSSKPSPLLHCFDKQRLVTCCPDHVCLHCKIPHGPRSFIEQSPS